LVSPGLGILIVDFAFLLLTVLNVAIAGYVPLIRGIMTGNTGYLDFGVHGLYGFYLAFANALGIFHLFLYFRTLRRWHLYFYYFLLLIFILFITRQNLLSLGVEGVIVYSLMRKRFSFKKVVLWLVLAGIMFSVIGSFRSGNIKTLAKIQPEYQWVPAPVIWLYSYSYFNVANVNNLILYSKAPFHDGSSLSQLLPSFLRPSFEQESYLQVEIFNVSSFLYPVYDDLGTTGVVILTAVAIFSTFRLRRSLYEEASLFRIGTFATLYFCAAFSFFVNLWFYLPVIFQIFFFKLLSNLAERQIEAVDAHDCPRLRT
jgi:oligosaccharide repeat unit polymerase